MGKQLIEVLLSGLTYYDTHDRWLLQSVIVLAYLGGGACLLEYISSIYQPKG